MEFFRSPGCSEYINKLMGRHNVIGIAIALVQNEVIASKGFGKASLDPPRDFTPDTLICVGSSSKSLTAAAIAQLVDDDKKYPEVRYKATMNSLLPDDFVISGKDHADVTLEDLLSHRTGMPPHEFSILGPQAEHPDDLRSITRNLRHLPTVAPNRMGFIYCNMMYTVATYLIERKTDITFSDFLERNVLEPLHMDSTSLMLKRAQAKGLGDRVATGYVRCKETGQHKGGEHSDSPQLQGAGEILSSVNDYAKLIEAMIYHNRPPITEDIFKGLTEKRIRQDPADEDLTPEQITYYALGWDVRQYGGYTIISHDGGEVGYQCTHFSIPELKFGGAIFSNSDHAGPLVSQLAFRLIDEVVQGPQPELSCQAEADDSQSESDYLSDGQDSDAGYLAELEERLREELCPCGKGPQPQEMSLSAYIGHYWHPGYRGIKIIERACSLFVDATDRSLGFTLTLKHMCEQTKYIACMSFGPDDGDLLIKAEFVLEGSRAVKVGLQLEERLEAYSWFDRVEE